MRKVCFSAVLSALVLLVSAPLSSIAHGSGANGISRFARQQSQQKAGDPASTASVSGSKPVKKEDCGCEVKQPPDVLAIVNGIKISTSEVEEPIKANVEDIQNQIVAGRKRALELEINSILIESEANKRGIAPAKLIDTEIIAKVPKPTVAEAQDFYDKNKAGIQGEFKDVKESVIAYLLNQKQQEQADKYAQSLRASFPVQVLVKDVTPPATAADRSRVLAVVNSRKITSGELEDSLKPNIYNAQQEIYKLRKNSLDLKINDILLNQQADTEKITSKALLDREVNAKIKPITDADAKDFYDKNKERIQGTYDDLKPKIIEYLQQQEGRNAEEAFANQLRKTATIKTFLKGPEAPVFAIAVDGRPAKGPATAPVTIVEFTDFQCPSCAKEAPILEKLVAEYGDRVRLVVRDFPLEQHQNAFRAAVAAEAAREQGKYWEYTDVLFHNQSALDVDKLKEYAGQLGLDRKKFDAELDANKFADTVKQDLQDGVKVGIDSTPTVFINGKKIDDKTYESLKATIDEELKEAGTKKQAQAGSR